MKGDWGDMQNSATLSCFATYKPTPVCYFFSIIYQESKFTVNSLLSYINDIMRPWLLESAGAVNIDSCSLWEPHFSPSLDYYSKQMGDKSQLRRLFITLMYPMEREHLVALKLKCMSLEASLSAEFRTLNLDPGYVALEQVVLSTHKPFAHRFFLRDQIYGELVYIFSKPEYVSLPWTYPDYQDLEKRAYFAEMRRCLADGVTTFKNQSSVKEKACLI